MLFNVRVVSPEEYDAYLKDLQAKGFESDEPLLGGVNAYEQAGLNDEQGSESGASSK